jgi:hypothetical protein
LPLIEDAPRSVAAVRNAWAGRLAIR